MEKHEAEQVVGEKIVLFVCVDSNELYRSYYAKTASGKKYRLTEFFTHNMIYCRRWEDE